METRNQEKKEKGNDKEDSMALLQDISQYNPGYFKYIFFKLFISYINDNYAINKVNKGRQI